MEKATTSLGEFSSSCVTAAESNTFPFCWQGVENRSTQKTCTQMLRAALFIIVKLTPPWRQIGITQGQVWIGYPGIGKSLSPAQYCYKCKSATIRSLCLLKGSSRQQWFHFGLQTSQRFTKRLPHTLELFHCTEGTPLPHCEITVLRIRFSCWLSSLWASPQHTPIEHSVVFQAIWEDSAHQRSILRQVKACSHSSSFFASEWKGSLACWWVHSLPNCLLSDTDFFFSFFPLKHLTA